MNDSSGVPLLELLLADSQLFVQVDPCQRNRVARISRIGDVSEDLAFWKRFHVLWKETIVLSLEESIGSSSFRGVTRNVDSIDLASLPDSLLLVELEDFVREREIGCSANLGRELSSIA